MKILVTAPTFRRTKEFLRLMKDKIGDSATLTFGSEQALLSFDQIEIDEALKGDQGG